MLRLHWLPFVWIQQMPEGIKHVLQASVPDEPVKHSLPAEEWKQSLLEDAAGKSAT